MNKAKLAEVQITKKSWPSPQDYNEALQNPTINLADPLLKVGKPALNKLGLPKAITGSFASVYYLDCPQQDFAVRCFLHNIADQKDRYAKISEYLNKIALPIMADFDYLDKGILAQSKWFPILKMDWVDGQNLIEYIGRNLDNPPVLEKLRQWLREARKTLKEHGIAHGDLQHGNVLVTNDKIKLVDYDGMYVPSLAGFPSNELGHRNYQHPGRTKADFGPYLDNFSAWLIDTCLYCLERDPRLWLTLHGGEDCLLFREADLKDPYSSFAFHELESHTNPEIREKAKLLRWLLTLPVDQIPDIDSDIKPPTELPALDASKKKPDWLSSAQHLMAKEVGPAISQKPVEQPPPSPSPPYRSSYSANWWKNHQANPANQKYSSGTSPPNTLSLPPSWKFGVTSSKKSDWLIFLIIMIFWLGGGILDAVFHSTSQPAPPPPPAQVVHIRQDVQSLFDRGTRFYEQKNYQSALEYYQKALAGLNSSGQQNTVEAANCHYWVGRMQMALKQFDQALKSLEQAENIYNESGLVLDVTKVEHDYGVIFLQQKQYDRAISNLETAMEGFEVEQSSQYMEDCKADTSYYLGWAYAGNHQDKAATKDFQRFVDYYEGATTKQAPYVARRLNEISRYFARHGQAAYAQQAAAAAKHVESLKP